MKDWLMGQGVILYVYAGCLAVGVLSAWIANRGYKRLIRESELMGSTQNRLLKYIKLKFGSYYKLNMRPQDTRALTRHYMYKYKIGFMNVTSWIKLSKLAVGVIGIAAIVRLLYMQAQGSDAQAIVSMAGCGLICAAFVYIQHRVYDFPEKQKMLEWYLMDYLENFLKNKIESRKAPVIEKENTDKAGKTEPEAEADSEFFNDPSRERITWDQDGNHHNEAAASRHRPAKTPASRLHPSDYKTSDPSDFSVNAPGSPEDEIDAKIVEDILKEFLV